MHYLRHTRHTSVIVTTVILIVVGLLVNVVRDDSPKSSDLMLRADQRQVQTQPTATVPPDVQPPASAIGAGPVPGGPTLTIPGAVRRPPPQKRPASTPGRATSGSTARGGGTGGGGGGSTNTPAPSGGGGSGTTVPESPGAAFAAGRIAYGLSGSVWTINPDGTDARLVATNAFFPAWSKDHGAIAVADADNPGGALYVLTAGGERLGVTTGVVDDAQPTWSPDGSKLAFARLDHTAQSDYSAIWIVNRDGSNVRKIATPSPCFSRDPAWSPDGRRIAFWSSRDHCDAGASQGDYTLYVHDLTTNTTTALGDARTNRGAPAWSPDGKTIAFSSDGDGGVGFEICLMDADGTGVRQITNLSGNDTDPSFSPDGKKIVFRSDRDGGGIYVMNANGSDIKVLVGGAVAPAWS